MLMLGWGLAAALGALAGVLIAPRLFLDVNLMGGVLIYAFAAAALGGFDSAVGAVVGGWIIGVSENLAGTYVDFIGSDLKILVPLGIIFVVLLVRPGGPVRHARGGESVTALRRGRARRLRGLAVLAVLVPFLFGPYRVGQFTLVLVYAVAVLGLNLLVGYNGQISLGHGAFFALGAYTAALLIEKAGVPYLLDAPGGGRVCFAAGLPVRRPGAAPARALPRAGHARPGDRHAAADQALRRPHRGHAGTDRRAARRAGVAAARPTTSSSTCSRSRSPRRCSSPPGT